MVWKIEWHPKAFKKLKKFPFKVQKRIINKVGKLRENPFQFLDHFHGKLYKLRIGDYRMLIDVDFKEKIIRIQVLDHRKRIYK